VVVIGVRVKKLDVLTVVVPRGVEVYVYVYACECECGVRTCVCMCVTVRDCV